MQNIFRRQIQQFHILRIAVAVAEMQIVPLCPEGRDNLHWQYQGQRERVFLHRIHRNRPGILPLAAGRQNPERQVAVERQHMLLSVFLPAHGVNGLSGKATRLFLGDQAYVLLHEIQMNQGILEMKHCGRINRLRVLDKELVGRLYGRLLHRLVVQIGLRPGLRRQGSREQQSAQKQYDSQRPHLIIDRTGYRSRYSRPALLRCGRRISAPGHSCADRSGSRRRSAEYSLPAPCLFRR